MEFLKDRRVVVVLGIAALVTVAAVTALAIAFNAGPEICVIESGGRRIEYACDQSGARASSASEPWWAGDVAQAVYAFIGFGIPAAGGAWAYHRHRARRQRLDGYMTRMDDTMAAHRARPADGGRALVALRQEMRSAFRMGRMDDTHFLELDKRATMHVVKLRLLELDHRFPNLPPSLRHQVATLIADGSVSEAEVGLVRHSLATQLIPGRVRDELLLVLDSWARQDAGAPEAAGPVSSAGTEEHVLVTLKEG